MASSPAQGTGVDDTQTFLESTRSSYPTYEEFLQDFLAFQRETYSSFYMYNSRTAKQYLKDEGGKLPPGFPYKFVKFCCVHRRRRSNDKKRRYIDSNCGAFVVVRAVGLEYRIVRYSLMHNHSFHVDKPTMYVRNRRLSAEEEAHLFELMGSMKGTRGLIQYALERFNKRIVAADVRSIRDRLSKSQNQTSEPPSSPVSEEENIITISIQEEDIATPTVQERNPITPTVQNRNPITPTVQKQPRPSTSTEQFVVTVAPKVSSTVAAESTYSGPSRDALTEQLMNDFTQTLKKMNESQFNQQWKTLRLLNEALNYWPRLGLFARMPGIDKIVSLSESTTVAELFEKFEQRRDITPVVSSAGSLATRSVTPKPIIRPSQFVQRSIPYARDQRVQSRSKRKPLLVLRETCYDGLHNSDEFLEGSRF